MRGTHTPYFRHKSEEGGWGCSRVETAVVIGEKQPLKRASLNTQQNCNENLPTTTSPLRRRRRHGSSVCRRWVAEKQRVEILKPRISYRFFFNRRENSSFTFSIRFLRLLPCESELKQVGSFKNYRLAWTPNPPDSICGGNTVCVVHLIDLHPVCSPRPGHWYFACQRARLCPRFSVKYVNEQTTPRKTSFVVPERSGRREWPQTAGSPFGRGQR